MLRKLYRIDTILGRKKIQIKTKKLNWIIYFTLSRDKKGKDLGDICIFDLISNPTVITIPYLVDVSACVTTSFSCASAIVVNLWLSADDFCSLLLRLSLSNIICCNCSRYSSLLFSDSFNTDRNLRAYEGTRQCDQINDNFLHVVECRQYVQ